MHEDFLAFPVSMPAESIVEQLFAQNTVGVAILDQDARYLRINEALARMNRLTVADHLGRTMYEVLPRAAAVLEPLLATVFAGRPVVDVESAVDEHGGRSRTFLGSFLPVRNGDEVVGMIALVVETTEDLRRRAELRASQERLQLALEGTETGTFEWVIATDRLTWSDNMGPMWGRERGWSPATYEDYAETLPPEDRELLAGDVRRARATGAGYEREFRAIWPDGRQRWMHSKVHVLPGEDGDPAVLIGLVSDITARRHRELASEYLARASLALAGSLDVRATLQQVAELAIPELGDWCAVHVTGAGERVDAVAVAHQRPDQKELLAHLYDRYPPDPGAPTGIAAVLRTGRPELYPELSDELLQAGARDPEHLRLMRELRVTSVMIVPMVARGRTVGTLTFAFAGLGREYGTPELELAEELGRRAGLAVENARLLHAEQESHRRLRALQAVTDVALAHLELGDLLAELLERVRDLTSSDLAEVLLIDEEQGEVQITAAGALEAEPASVLRVPLRAESEEIGALRLCSIDERVVAEEDVELLELVADRAARAIVHARVFEQARTTAVTLQRSLLPARLPELPGYALAVRYLPGQQGAEVGGDFYDAFPLTDGRHALVVGDVVGRGVGAAAHMGQLRASLRAYAYQHPDPAAALEQLDLLTDGLGGVDFATIAVMALDTRDGGAVLSLAGHPPPLLRRAGGGCERLDAQVDVPLGGPVGPRRAFGFKVEPGDLVLFYTDGLVERRGLMLDDRIDALCAAISAGPEDPEALLDHVVAELLSAGRTDDDVALVAIRRSA